MRLLLLIPTILVAVKGFYVHYPPKNLLFGKSDDERNRSWLIFPGTKWCGAGNIAQSEQDLGLASETDKCCRSHDHCDDIIEAGESAHGLTNNSPYTRLNCRCDVEFYDCLRAARTATSTKVGITYFNVLNTKCFREDFPIVGCAAYSPVIRDRCVKYEFDKNSPAEWQWFDVPTY